MAELFDSIIACGYGRKLAIRSPEQLKCREYVDEHLPQILFARSRERHLRDVVICVGAYISSDEDEPLTITHFAQNQFFEPFDELCFFIDKFDFLMCCIAAGIVNVAVGFEARFMNVFLRCLVNESVPPQRVLDMPRVLERPMLKRRTKAEGGSAALHKKIAELSAGFETEDADGQPLVLTEEERGLLEADEQHQTVVESIRERMHLLPEQGASSSDEPKKRICGFVEY